MSNWNSEKCKQLSTFTFLPNLIMEMQVKDRIIQRKGKIKEDYKTKINSPQTVMYFWKFTRYVIFYKLSHFKAPKTLVLPSLMVGIKSTHCLHGPQSHTVPPATYCHNFDTTDGKNSLSTSGSWSKIYLWPIVMITQCRENLEIWKETLDGSCHISNHIYNYVCWEFMHWNMRWAIPEKETES